MMLAQRFPGAELWAVDLAEAMIREAVRKAPADVAERVHFSVADAGALPFEDASFDLVCQLNLPLYADQIARVLAPGGHVVIASSRGPRTPYYTPESVVHRRFEKNGLHILPSGQVGEGTYFLARKPPVP
jgi:ubiquinone/menaquinone biosynthesis C-methylase UbiE